MKAAAILVEMAPGHPNFLYRLQQYTGFCISQLLSKFGNLPQLKYTSSVEIGIEGPVINLVSKRSSRPRVKIHVVGISLFTIEVTILSTLHLTHDNISDVAVPI